MTAVVTENDSSLGPGVKVDLKTCLICSDEIEAGHEVHCCSDKSHNPLCPDCHEGYINSIVSGAYLGSCPAVTCPNPGCLKTRKIWRYDEWKLRVPPEMTAKYDKLGSSLMAFLCGGCHNLKSIDLGFDRSEATSAAIQKYCDDSDGRVKCADFTSALERFQHGDISVDAFYEMLCEQLMLLSQKDYEAFELFSLALKSIADPERRANIHLRYLRDRPRFKTLCCKREHCYRCKVRDFHEGKTCMDVSATLDNNVVNCPQCGIALAKGDGCDSIVCVCGKNFSWNTEKTNQERSANFVKDYPENTSEKCVFVLCEGPTLNTPITAAKLNEAKAWQKRHRMEVNHYLREWFLRKYQGPVNASQAFVTLNFNKEPEAVREAAQMFKEKHESMIAHRLKEKNVAVNSLFSTMFPHPRDQVGAALSLQGTLGSRFHNSDFHKRLIDSSKAFITNNKQEYARGLLEYEARSAKQFLLAFGNKSPFTSLVAPSGNDHPIAAEWDLAQSCDNLTYTENGTSCKRVGSVSCYPAAFANVPADRSAFFVRLDEAQQSCNWLSFGVAKKGAVRNQSSDGIGRSSNSWGIANDRNRLTNETRVVASGSNAGTFRPLQEGDVLEAFIDTAAGYCDIKVNENELEHRFDIPVGSADEYVFAMSFANDHRVTIIEDPFGMCRTRAAEHVGKEKAAVGAKQMYQGSPMNKMQAASLTCLKKHIKMIAEEKKDEDMSKPISAKGNALDESPLVCAGSTFVNEVCDGDEALASSRVEQIKNKLPVILGKLSNTRMTEDGLAAAKMETESMPWLTWNTLLSGLSWFHENRAHLQAIKEENLAALFTMQYGEDAPFIAAVNLAQYHTHKVESDERDASLAFMRVHAPLMHDWYERDQTNVEPIIENIPHNCKCLPRHTGSCPHC